MREFSESEEHSQQEQAHDQELTKLLKICLNFECDPGIAKLPDTLQRKIEEKLKQSQKREFVGRSD